MVISYILYLHYTFYTPQLTPERRIYLFTIKNKKLIKFIYYFNRVLALDFIIFC